jgi:hypothetical protein
MNVEGTLDLEKCGYLRQSKIGDCWDACTFKLCTLLRVNPAKKVDYNAKKGAYELYKQ